MTITIRYETVDRRGQLVTRARSFRSNAELRRWHARQTSLAEEERGGFIGIVTTKVSGTPARRIRENAWGNWYGYEGGRLARMFFGSGNRQKDDAEHWMAGDDEAGSELKIR